MKARLLPLYFIGFILLFYSSVIASSSDTTIYLSSIEKNIESGEVKVYYGAGNGSIARSINRDGTSTISYLHSDHLGSTILITKPDKTREISITYFPYGKETTIIPSFQTDKLYTNQRKDTSSDLYFYNARYYNPKISHFISADKAEGPNRYSYVSNNPIMKNDPSGKQGEAESLIHWIQGGWRDAYKILKSDIPFGYKAMGIYDEYSNHQISGLANAINLTFYPGSDVPKYGMERINAASTVGMVAVGTAEAIVSGGYGAFGKSWGFSGNMMGKALSSSTNRIDVGNFYFKEFKTKLEKGGLDMDYSTEIGPLSSHFIERSAARIRASNDPVGEWKTIMSQFKYATEAGYDNTAFSIVGYKTPTLEGVVQTKWGGCYELAELGARIGQRAGIKVRPLGLFTETYGGHTVDYLLGSDMIFDPSRNPQWFIPSSDYFLRQVNGLPIGRK